MSRNSKTYVISVEGMFCENCEKRITEKLTAVDGVSSCAASFKKSEVRVTCDSSVSRKILVDSIIALGYSEKKDSGHTVQIVSILFIILAVYLVLNHLGLLTVFNIFPTIENTIELPFLFVIGLLTSVHCIAMCGGINLTQSVNAAQKQEKALKTNLLYNLGRVISYTVIGGIAGAVGSVLSFGGSFKGIVAIIAGAIMLLMALRMLGVFKSLRKLRLPIPKKLAIGYAKLLRGRSSFFIGLLNGLMPCGPLQSMQIYALSTGSFLTGALSMLLFSLGTVPLMFGFGFISGRLNAKYTRHMLTVSAVLIFVMGVSMLTNGLTLSGVSVPQTVSEQPKEAVMSGDIQTVTTEVDYGSYEPLRVKSGVPVEWTIVVPEGKLNGCNGEIVVPAFDIDVKLREGGEPRHLYPTASGDDPLYLLDGYDKKHYYCGIEKRIQMENIRIRYYSKLGHTKKVAEYLTEELGVEAKVISEEDFDAPCNLLFLGGAPYANIMDKELKQYVEKLSKEDVKAVALFTTSNWSRRTVLSIRKTLTGKGIAVLPDHLYVHMLAVDGAREKARQFAKDTVSLLDL